MCNPLLIREPTVKKLIFTGLLSLFSSSVLSIETPSIHDFEMKGHREILNSSSVMEVESVFWYGCPHCLRWHDSIEIWSSQHPEVKVVHVPSPLSDLLNVHARLFYTVEKLGMGSHMHREIYETVLNQEKAPLENGEDIVKFLAGYGANPAEVREIFFSDSITSQVISDYERLKNYNVAFTPALVVDGQFLFSPAVVGGMPLILDVLEDELSKRKHHSVSHQEHFEGDIR